MLIPKIYIVIVKLTQFAKICILSYLLKMNQRRNYFDV
jgi:hypothetical protein